MNADSKTDQFKALFEISQAINSIKEIDPLLSEVMDIAMKSLEAERGFILLKSGNSDDDFSIRVTRNISEEGIVNITNISTSIVRKVWEKGEPIITVDAQEDNRFYGAQSVILHNIRSVVCVPFNIKDRSIGVIYVDSLSHSGRFNQESVEFLTAFANNAAIAIENAQLYEALKSENRRLKKEVRDFYGFEGIIGQSDKMKHIYSIISDVLDSDASVLIEGESGTGKELVAKAIHYNGHRKDKPFVALFCGTLSESLLESELFGHKKGAFTGAVADKKGLFEEADAGTFFLDEIGDISAAIQTKLLRVLQEGEIKRVGENIIRKVDVRIISATNKILQEEVRNGNFREDLYYRLNVIPIYMPPLRERKHDISLIAHYFLDRYLPKSKKKISGFTKEAVAAMLQYNWPGNVRELENTIERAIVFAKKQQIIEEDLRLPATKDMFEPDLTLKAVERNYVTKTLSEVGNNITKAAEVLGVSRRWLHYRLKEWGEVE